MVDVDLHRSSGYQANSSSRMQDRWAMIIDHTLSYLLNYHSPVVGPHSEHGEAEAEAEEGQEHRVQVVQVERGHRVELQKSGKFNWGRARGEQSKHAFL